MSSRKIFAFWHAGRAEASPLVQRCLAKWEELNPTYSLEVYDLDAARAEMADRPRWITDLPIQAFSDVLRVHLLRRYGGVWVDATLLPTAPLDEWLPPVLGPTGFFAFSQPGQMRRLDSWFLAARPEAPMCRRFDEAIRWYWDRPRTLSPESVGGPFATSLSRGWRRWLHHYGRVRWNSRYAREPLWVFSEEGRQSEYYPYFWLHHITQLLEETDAEFRGGLEQMPFWPMSLPLLIQHAVKTRGFTDRQMEKALPMFLAVSPVHKLDWRWDWPECLFSNAARTELRATA